MISIEKQGKTLMPFRKLLPKRDQADFKVITEESKLGITKEGLVTEVKYKAVFGTRSLTVYHLVGHDDKNDWKLVKTSTLAEIISDVRTEAFENITPYKGKLALMKLPPALRIADLDVLKEKLEDMPAPALTLNLRNLEPKALKRGAKAGEIVDTIIEHLT